MRFVEFARFLVAGGVNTLAGYAVYLLLLGLCPYPVAYTLAYVFGIALAYGLTCVYVFREPTRLRTAMHFPVVYVVQYVVGLSMLVALVGLGVGPRVAPILVVVCTTPLTFIMSARVVRGASRATVIAESR